MKKIMCTECREFINYNVKEKIVTEKLKDKMCTYSEIIATCPICNSRVYVGEIEDENMKRIWDVYRNKNKIVILS